MPGDDGLPEDLQGGQTPEIVSERSRVQPETKASRREEERPNEGHREGECVVVVFCFLKLWIIIDACGDLLCPAVRILGLSLTKAPI